MIFCTVLVIIIAVTPGSFYDFFRTQITLFNNAIKVCSIKKPYERFKRKIEPSKLSYITLIMSSGVLVEWAHINRGGGGRLVIVCIFYLSLGPTTHRPRCSNLPLRLVRVALAFPR
uniref:Uncharacterized protein n=1 Tax=Thermococcus sp. EXT9 TaxID=1197732 RepID=L0B9Q2_9EURY|nr:hypothetical protein e9a-9 [Thermococcus sp. EXT9]